MTTYAEAADQLREDAKDCWGIRRKHNLLVAADLLDQADEDDAEAGIGDLLLEHATKDNVRLRAELHRYGGHIFPTCPCTRGAPAKCDCGWDEVKATLLTQHPRRT